MSSQKGYTLIEMLIVSVVIVAVLGTAIGALTMIVINRNKTAAHIQLKREGEYAVQTIVKAITPGAMVVEDISQGLACGSDMTQIGVRGREGQSSLFICDPETDELSLNNESMINTTLNYDLTSCLISCNNIDRAYQRYQIDFAFTLRDTKHSFEMPFVSQVVLRN